MSVIHVDQIRFKYAGKYVLKDLSFDVDQGTFLSIAGPNGAGKSTLLELLCGNLKPDSGKISVNGNKVSSYTDKELAGQIAVVRQEFIPAFGFTVAETVLTARTIHFSQLGFESADDRNIADEAMALTETIQFADRRLEQLSGGERQRVFIARALAQDTPILLLDEPTSFLDMRHQIGIYDLLKKLRTEKGKTIVTISHDVNLASRYSDRILFLCADQGYFIGDTKDVFTKEILTQTFGITGKFTAIDGKNMFVPITISNTEQAETDPNPT